MQEALFHSKSTSTKRSYSSAVLYHFAAVLAFCWLMLMVLWDNPMDWEGILRRGDIFLLVGLALLMALGVLWIGSRRRDFDPLEIVYPITALYILHFPMRAMFIMLWTGEVRLPFNWPVNSEAYTAFALGLSILGMLFFYLGYFWFGSSRVLSFVPRIPFRWTERYLTLKILILYGLGLSAFVVLFSGGLALRFQPSPDRASQSFYSQFLLLGTLRLYALFLALANKDRSILSLLLALGLLVTEASLGFLIGSKQAIFQTLLAVVLVYHYVLQRDWRRIVLVIGVVFLFGFFPLVQNYRAVYKAVFGFRPDPTLGDIVGAASELPDELGDSSSNWVYDTVEGIGKRANNLDSLTMVIRYVPEVVEFQRGTTLNLIFAGFIPRPIWPDKPVLKLGRFMTTDIVGSDSPTSKPVTDVGEFYLNYGILGVPIGMFLLGMTFRAIYAYVWRSYKSRIFQTMYYLAVFPIMLFNPHSGVASVFVALVRTTLVVLVVTFFLSRGAIKAS